MRDAVKNYYQYSLTVEIQSAYKLSFPEIFLQAGDVCLFQYRNIFFAKEFYVLAGLDWDYTEDISLVNPLLPERSRRLAALSARLAVQVCALWYEEDDEMIEYLCQDDDFLLEQVLDFDELIYEIWDVFDATENTSDAETLYVMAKNVLDKYSRFCEQYRQTDKLDDVGIALCSLTGLMLRMQQRLLPDQLVRLCKGSQDIQRQYMPAVLTTLMQNVLPDGSRIYPIWQYAEEKIVSYEKWNRLQTMDLSQFEDSFRVVLDLALFIHSVDEIMKTLLVPPSQDDQFAYYTSYETLGYMFWKDPENSVNYGRLPLMHVAYMNDPNEGKVLNGYLFGTNSENGPRKNLREPYVFLKCFTDQVDDLPMWEMYGDGAKGVCVVLSGFYYPTVRERMEGTPLKSENKTPMELYRVLYLNNTKKPDHRGEMYTLEYAYNQTLSQDKIEEIRQLLQELKVILSRNLNDGKYFNDSLGKLRYLFKDADYLKTGRKR